MIITLEYNVVIKQIIKQNSRFLVALQTIATDLRTAFGLDIIAFLSKAKAIFSFNKTNYWVIKYASLTFD